MMDIKQIACIGSGTIGASWATNFVMRGYPVGLYDIKPEQLAAAKASITRNLSFLVKKGVITESAAAKAAAMVKITTNMEEAVADVQFIQESGPEEYAIKQELLAQIEKYTAPQTLIASSTSGLLISEIVKFAQIPERCLGAHPYNPPHLIPLVEITRGEKTAPEVIQRACAFYTAIGKEPVVLKKEKLGFIANRLQLALAREFMDLIMTGACTVEDIDKALLFGPGLRSAILGPVLTMHLGGGAGGARALYTALHNSSQLWLEDMAKWTAIPREWPEIAHAGVLQEIEHRQAEFGKTSAEIAEFRDNMLVEILKLHKKL